MTERAADAETEPLRCLACEYVLVGLDERGRCPECGLPIDESLRAAGGWSVRRLRILRLATASLLVAIGAWLLFAFILWAVLPTPTIRLVATGCVALHALALATAAVAGTLAASRQRKPARLAIVGVVVGIFILLALIVIGLLLRVSVVIGMSRSEGIVFLSAIVRAAVLAIALWFIVGSLGSLAKWSTASALRLRTAGLLVALPWLVFFFGALEGGMRSFDRFGVLALWSDACFLTAAAVLCVAILVVASRRIALRTADA